MSEIYYLSEIEQRTILETASKNDSKNRPQDDRFNQSLASQFYV